MCEWRFATAYGCMRMPLLRRRSNGFEASCHYCDHVGGGLVRVSCSNGV
nr:MAG TPA: hypothetical protein [Caudoviricetes sp.]